MNISYVTENWTNSVTALAAVVAAIATVAYTRYSKRMWQSMAETARFTRQSFEATNRPLVGIRSVDVHIEESLSPFVAILDIANVGNVPATNVRVEGEIWASDSPSSAVEAYPRGFVLLPNSNMVASQCILSDDLASLLDGRVALSLTVTVKYSGVRGDEYETRSEFTFDSKHNTFRPGRASLI
ncbi:MAG: hypothetical protein HY046_00080 [Acidobacteria bacterium]|nr:hypothetical protein [Acidobacteriota bacterium]